MGLLHFCMIRAGNTWLSFFMYNKHYFENIKMATMLSTGNATENIQTDSTSSPMPI